MDKGEVGHNFGPVHTTLFVSTIWCDHTGAHNAPNWTTVATAEWTNKRTHPRCLQSPSSHWVALLPIQNSPFHPELVSLQAAQGSEVEFAGEMEPLELQLSR